MARRRKHRPRFLDEPFLAVQLDLERLQRELRALASRAGSPLPERLRAQLGLMARQLARMRREIRSQPDQIEAERLREDQKRQRPPA